MVRALILTFQYMIARPLPSLILWFFMTGLNLILLLSVSILEGPQGLKSAPFLALGLSFAYSILSTSIPYIFSGLIAPDAFQFRRKRSVSIEETWDIFVECGPALVIASLLSSLFIYLGSLACFIPGVVFLCMFPPVGPLTTMERYRATEAVSQAAQMTRGARLGIFLAYFISGILAGIPMLLAYLLLDDVTRFSLASQTGQLTRLSMPGILAVTMLSGLYQSCFAIFNAMVYTELCGVDFSTTPLHFEDDNMSTQERPI